MSISRVGATSAAASSLLSPAGAAGDIIVWTAYRDASATAPGAISSPVKNLVNGGASSNSGRVGYEFCTSASAVTRSSSNATRMSAVRYSGVLGLNAGTLSAASGTSLNFPAASLLLSTKSWWFAYAGVRTGTVPTPSGLSTFTNSSIGTGPNLAVFDSDGEVTSNWSSTNVTVNNTGHISGVIELIGNHGGFNKYDVGSGVTYTISTENKVANCNNPGSGHGGVRAFTAHKTGKRALAWRQIAQGETYDITLGLIALGESLSAWPDNGAVVQLDTDGGVMYMGDGATTSYGPFTPPQDGDYGYTVFDLDAGLMWTIHQHMTDWNDDPSANPNAGTGGIPYTSAKGLDLFPFTGSGNINSSLGMNLSDLNDQAPTWTFPSNASDFLAWDAVASNSYTLQADHGSVTLTGQDAALRRGYTLAAGYGSFALAGESVALVAGRRLSATYGSFALAGESAALVAARRLSAAYGSVTLTGQDAALRRGHTLAAGYGSFALAGESVALVAARRLSAAYGSFTLTGEGAGLHRGHQLVAACGTFALDGQSVGLLRGHALAAGYGSFIVSGEDAALSRSRRIAAGYGSVTLTGEALGFNYARRLAAAYGSFALDGIAADLVYGRALTLNAQKGSFVLTGKAAGLRASRQLVASAGLFVESGQAARLLRGRRLGAGYAVYALTGQDAELRRAHELIAIHGAFTLTGEAAGLVAHRILRAGRGVFVLTGIDAELIGNALDIDPATFLFIEPRPTALLVSSRSTEILVGKKP